MYDSDEQALASLEPDDVDMQCVRLVQVAANKQLKVMLETGSEVCRPKAALYLRLSKLCPLYWVTWSSVKDDADLDLVSDIPQFGNRDQFLNKLRTTDGQGGVRARLARNKATGSRGTLLLNPGGRVVGAPCFGTPVVAEEISDEEEEGENDGDDDEEGGHVAS